jgi:VIT1/CCC1 family predicted Fe2+/Mn2+ transporter
MHRRTFIGFVGWIAGDELIVRQLDDRTRRLYRRIMFACFAVSGLLNAFSYLIYDSYGWSARVAIALAVLLVVVGGCFGIAERTDIRVWRASDR